MNTVAASPMSPQTDIHSSRVLILDFGAQYTQLIAPSEPMPRYALYDAPW